MQARLFDYECITVEGKNSQPRVVAFGKFAGMAGMIDCFQGLGLKLLAEGIVSHRIELNRIKLSKDTDTDPSSILFYFTIALYQQISKSISQLFSLILTISVTPVVLHPFRRSLYPSLFNSLD